MKAINKDKKKRPHSRRMRTDHPGRSEQFSLSFFLSCSDPKDDLGLSFPPVSRGGSEQQENKRKTGPRMLSVHPSLPCAQREKRYVANVDDHVHSLIKLASHAPTGQALTLPHTCHYPKFNFFHCFALCISGSLQTTFQPVHRHCATAECFPAHHVFSVGYVHGSRTNKQTTTKKHYK